MVLSFLLRIAHAVPTGVGFNPSDNEEMGEPRPMTLPPDSIGRGLAPVSSTLDTRTEGVTKRDGALLLRTWHA